MMTKFCRFCERERDISEFHKSKTCRDGFNTKCKECISAYTKLRYQENREELIQKSRDYYHNGGGRERMKEDSRTEEFKKRRSENKRKPHRQKYAQNYGKKWREINPDYGKLWRQENRDRLEEYRRKYKANDPGRFKARSAVTNAVASGRMAKVSTKACVLCGEQAEQYHHHLGYEPEHWLDVEPVCRKCHTAIHHAPSNLS